MYTDLDREVNELLMKIGELNGKLMIVRECLKNNDVDLAIKILNTLIMEEK